MSAAPCGVISTEQTHRSKFMAGHTIMPPRIQKTPHGDVTITSKWVHNRYYLVAIGSMESILWLFPDRNGQRAPERNGNKFRHLFLPGPNPVTVERDLRRIAARWQDAWNSMLEDAVSAGVDGQSEVKSDHERPETLSGLIDLYTSARKGELAQRTVEKNRHYLARWLEEIGPSVKLHDVRQKHLVDARQRLLMHISISTANDSFALLRSVFRWAVAHGYMQSDPSLGMKNLRDTTDKPEKAWWTEGDVDLALNCARLVDRDLAGTNGTVGNTAELLVALGCLLGLRYEEIIMLRWEDVDLDAVHKNTGVREPVCRVRGHDGWTPKDGEDRAIPIHQRLADILKGHRKASGYILEAKSPKPRHGAQKHTYRYDPQRIWDRIIKRVVEAGGKRISPHGMRHSFASNFLMAGVSDVLVASWLGHANTTMIHKRYAHLRAYHGDINKIRIS